MSYSVRHRIIEPEQAVVDLDTDKTTYNGSCPTGQFFEVASGDGIEINADSTYFPDAQYRPDRPIHLNGAVAYVSNTDPYDILNIAVLVAGHRKPVAVQIGLAGTGSTARSILYSIRGS